MFDGKTKDVKEKKEEEPKVKSVKCVAKGEEKEETVKAKALRPFTMCHKEVAKGDTVEVTKERYAALKGEHLA